MYFLLREKRDLTGSRLTRKPQLLIAEEESTLIEMDYEHSAIQQNQARHRENYRLKK